MARQEADKAKRLARNAAATTAAAQTPLTTMPLSLPANAVPITAPRPAIPDLATHEGSTARRSTASVPALKAAASNNEQVVLQSRSAPVATSPQRASRLALMAIAMPFAVAIGAVAARLLSTNNLAMPPPTITAPLFVANAPLRSDVAIRQRILEMTPALALQRPDPAWPSSVAGSIRFAALSLPSGPPEIAVIVPPRTPLVLDVPLPSLPAPSLTFERPSGDVAAAAPTEPQPSTQPLGPSQPVDFAIASPPATIPAPPVDTARSSATDDRAAAQAGQCRPTIEAAEPAPAPIDDPAAFGLALATTAAQQTRQFIVYDARYTRISYPGGDVATLHGVCTDVVIRAYRALGIDLQRMVYESRVGVGDTSIDHRRTETLRRFLATHGDVLPTTAFAEDYLPGDIVTYYRPQNRISTAHIAIVSDQLGPSGRPMIIHNRGLGVQLEDGLFVDRVTGHYRYLGPRTPLPPLAIAARARPTKTNTSTAALATPSVEQAVQRTTAAAIPVMRAAAKSPAAQKLSLRFAQQQETAANPPANRAATRAVDKPRP